MKSIITVVGTDKVGIIAEVSNLLAENNINILDIDQSIMEGFFNMFMIVDTENSTSDFKEIVESFDKLGEKLGISITVQRAELFEEMYRISGGSL